MVQVINIHERGVLSGSLARSPPPARVGQPREEGEAVRSGFVSLLLVSCSPVLPACMGRRRKKTTVRPCSEI